LQELTSEARVAVTAPFWVATSENAFGASSDWAAAEQPGALPGHARESDHSLDERLEVAVGHNNEKGTWSSFPTVSAGSEFG